MLWRIRDYAESNAYGHTRLINDFKYLVCFILHIHSLANDRIQHVLENKGLRRSRMLIDTLV